MTGALSWFLDLLYPPKCVFCRKLLERDEVKICNPCRMQLPAADGTIQAGPYIDTCVAALYYEGIVRESLLRYKFEGMEQYSDCFGELLAAAISARLPKDAYDMLTWVPISKRRLRKRGYDQAMLLAVAVAKRLNMKVLPMLEKPRDNPAQSSLQNAAERRANVLGAYCPLDDAAIAGRRILLVDDILTTGATASEAARVLLTAGASSVCCAVLAAKRTSNM